MEATLNNSNLLEIIQEQLLQADSTLDIVKNQLVCDGKLKASILVKTSKGKQYIVEVLEDELAHYKPLEEGQTKSKPRLR